MTIADYFNGVQMAYERRKLAEAIAPRCHERHWIYKARCTQPLTDGAHVGMHLGTAEYQGREFPIMWAQVEDEELTA